uniref:Secreted protein n=2 Tax=Mesocestoides corti TaxID=53468 RepID=A0A5K3FVM2_MESCO
MNLFMEPQWHWFFRQTRWPFRFAPQQNVDLRMRVPCVPEWQPNAISMYCDVKMFCKRNREMKNLILLDAMALSPLSPLLNLMRHSVEPKAHLTGILWMTPVDALSPSYCV